MLAFSTATAWATCPIVDFTVETEWWYTRGTGVSGFYQVVNRTGPGTNVYSVIFIRGKEHRIPFRLTTAASVCLAVSGLGLSLVLVYTRLRRSHGNDSGVTVRPAWRVICSDPQYLGDEIQPL
jgi:hypothetical protein